MGVCARVGGGDMGSNASHTGSIIRTQGGAFTIKNTPPSHTDFLSNSEKPPNPGKTLTVNELVLRDKPAESRG
jgi:hypothetical protein